METEGTGAGNGTGAGVPEARAASAAIADLEARILRLESDHAYHQGALEDYDSQFYRMERRVERLEEAMGKLVAAMKDVADSKQGPLPLNERPPHY